MFLIPKQEEVYMTGEKKNVKLWPLRIIIQLFNE